MTYEEDIIGGIKREATPAEMDRALRAVRETISGLISDERVRSYSRVFFHILTSLAIKYDNNVIAATDGSYLYVGKEFADYSKEDREFILFHETTHVIDEHPIRGIGKIHNYWNQAADYMVNGDLHSLGLKVPMGALFNPAYDIKQLTTNDIYNELVNNKKYKDEEEQSSGIGGGQEGSSNSESEPSGQKNGQPQRGKSSKGWLGDDLKDYNPERESVVRQAVKEAAKIAEEIANGNGSSFDKNVAAGLRDLIRQHVYNKVVDWKALLAEYVSRYTVDRKYTFALPSKKYISEDIYMPRRVRERGANAVVVIDTSMSISDDLLTSFLVEVDNIFADEELEGFLLLFSDTVYYSLEVPPFPSPEDVLLQIASGGTDFEKVLDWVEVNAPDIDVMIVFTDMAIETNLAPPPYPVIWVTKTPNKDIKYGDVVEI